MAAIARELNMTESEYDAWCWTVEERTEFKDGKVIFLSPELKPTEDERVFLSTVLKVYVDARQLGAVYGPNYQIRPRAGLRRVPDLMFISHRKLAQAEDEYLIGGPDLAIEFVSRRSGRRDRVEKFAEYERAGVGEYWIIDPRKLQVDPFVLNAAGRYEPLPVTDGVLRSRAVPGFWLRIAWLWQRPMPSTLQVLRALGVAGPPHATPT